MKGFELGLALKQRRNATQKSLIVFSPAPCKFPHQSHSSHLNNPILELHWNYIARQTE